MAEFRQLLRSFTEFLQLEKNYSEYTVAAYQKDLEHFFCFLKEQAITSPYRSDGSRCPPVFNGTSQKTLRQKIGCPKDLLFAYIL